MTAEPTATEQPENSGAPIFITPNGERLKPMTEAQALVAIAAELFELRQEIKALTRVATQISQKLK